MKKIYAYLNIAPHEVSRVNFSWLVKLLLDASHIFGHTLLLYYISVYFGVYNLPYFLLIEGIIIVFFSLVYKKVNIQKEKLILILIILGILSLILSYVYYSNHIIFILLFFLAYSVFTYRVILIFNMVIESLFSPLESSRAIPIIETAILFAGLIVGSIISVFTYYHINPSFIIILWALSMLFAFIIIYTYQNKQKKITLSLEEKIEDWKINEVYLTIKNNSFLHGLSIVVILIFFVSKIMEFIYTVGINELSEGKHDDAILHGLGVYTLCVSFVGILVQLFISQRWIKYSGVIHSMKIIPIFNIISLFSLFTSLKAYPPIITKFVFDVLHNIFIDSYTISYYILKESLRENIKPIFESIIKQIGMILGTIALIIIDIIVHKMQYNMIHILAIFLIIIYIYIYFSIRKLTYKYTELAKKSINSPDIFNKFNAIEILSQKGHEGSFDILIKTLELSNDIDVKEKILKIIVNISHDNILPYLLNYIQNPDKNIKIAALKAISHANINTFNFYKTAFTMHRLIEILKNMFNEESDIKIKKLILDIFSKLNYNTVIPFLLDLLDKSDDVLLKKNILNVLYKFDDPSICFYVEDLLNHKSFELQCMAISIMYKFGNNRIKLMPFLNKLLISLDDDNKTHEVIEMLTKMNTKQEEKKLIELYNKYKNNILIAKKILVALISFGNLEYIDDLCLLLYKMNEEQQKNLFELVDHIENKKYKDIVIKRLYHEIYSMIHNMLLDYDCLNNMDKLNTLLHLYKLVNYHKEILKIKKLIEEIKHDNN